MDLAASKIITLLGKATAHRNDRFLFLLRQFANRFPKSGNRLITGSEYNDRTPVKILTVHLKRLFRITKLHSFLQKITYQFYGTHIFPTDHIAVRILVAGIKWS